MPDPDVTPPRVSNRISPLAIIIVLALIVCVLIAVFEMRGRHVTPTGVSVPTTQTMTGVQGPPRQSTVPDTLQPKANTNDASESQGSPNQPGGPPANSGPANGTGGG